MVAELATTIAPADDNARLLQAESVVRGYCGWHIAPSRTETVTLRGSCSATLILRSLHVTEVVSVTVDGTVLTADDYSWSAAGVLTRGGCAIWTETDVMVEFTHGYAEAPAEITGAVQAIAQRGISNPMALKSWTKGPFSETYGDSVDGSGDLQVLNRYKLPARP